MSIRTGVIGLGDMGSGIAKNLLKGGFPCAGFDLSEARLTAFRDMGGDAADSAEAVAGSSDVVFVMVMNGAQAYNVMFGERGLTSQEALKPGSTIILTATILPQEARDLGATLKARFPQFDMIDCPVSGGFPGAQSGQLTLMAAAPDPVLEKCRGPMEAISKAIHKVGDAPGEGQMMKVCVQAVIGGIFSATFEAAALAAKAGVSGEAFYNVLSTSSGGCTASNTALQKVIDREFEGGGSHIATMHKDLTIVTEVAKQYEVPLWTASAAMQLFHAGKVKYPNGDNWTIARVLEEIIGAELHRNTEA